LALHFRPNWAIFRTIAAVLDPDFLDLEWCRILGIAALRNNLKPLLAAPEHREINFLLAAHPHSNKCPSGPPFRLEVAQTAQRTFPIADDCFLDRPVCRVGVRDSFCRVNWAPRRDVRQARRNLHDFRLLASDSAAPIGPDSAAPIAPA
jgi:hypothetical protein